MDEYNETVQCNGFTNQNGTDELKVLKVQDVIGKALPHIGPYKKLDNKRQVVALIDDV